MYDVDRLIKFEEKNSLYDIEIQGVRFWHIVRFSIFQNYINSFVTDFKEISKDKEKESVTKSKSSKPALKINQLSGLFKIFSKNPFLIKKNTEILIFNSPRRVQNGDKFICPYTDDYVKHLEKSYAIIERPYLGTHYYETPKTNLYYADMMVAILGIASKLKLLPNCNYNDKQKIKSVVDKLGEEFNINEVDKRKMSLYIQHRIQRHLFNYKLYKFLFKKIKPKLIIEFCSYSNLLFTINQVANDLNIDTVELQHGVMGKHHIGYNFGNIKKLDTFPNNIFLFGQVWKDTTRLPLSDDRLILTGWPYFERRVAESKIKKGDKSNILFLSQPYSGVEISRIAIELSNLIDLNKYEITYKLHPKEYNSWKDEYPWLIESNVKVIDNNLNDIYYFMAKADFQIGCNSTALFEGLGFNLNTVVLKIPGHEYMQVMYESNYVQLIKDAEQIMQYILEKSNEKIEVDYSYYWYKSNVEGINDKIDVIISKKD